MQPDDAPRRPWARSDRLVPRLILRPLQQFLATSTASGWILLAAAFVAIVWANAPFQASYERLWTTPAGVSIGGWGIHQDVRYWANEGLMALFFLVAGLEIKRELVTGELRDRRSSILPIAAAIGGMVVPALIYLAFDATGPGARGWGVPMPTDLAFALGVLTVACRNAPPGAKAFLLTLAIADDLGTIVAIALFSSIGIRWEPLLLVALLAVAVVAAERIHVRSVAVYAALGIGMWLAMQRSGVHPALAGVVIGLLTPATPFQRPRTVSQEAHRVADATVDDPSPPDADSHHWLQLSTLTREAVSPLARLEHVLLPWVSFVVLPLFALANAGVRVSGDALAASVGGPIFRGIVVGRLVGKLVGIVGVAWLVVRLGAGRLPADVTWGHVAAIAAAASVPFTVSLFVADLALPAPLAEQAKLAIVACAVAGGLLTAAIGSRVRPVGPSPVDG